jgi:hypothetical protein
MSGSGSGEDGGGLESPAGFGELDPCDAIEARVLEGARAQDDPALAAHLGSCLRCFRTASELRELPRIEGFLRAAPAQIDPGEAFWQSFPGRVADAWAAAAPVAAAPAPVAAPPSPWYRFTRWLRLPIPAALSGALCASVVVYLLARGHAPAPQPLAALEPLAAPAALATVEDEAGAEHADHDDEAAEDFVHSLDATGLELLLEPALARGTTSAEAIEAEEDDAPAAEELDLLDEAELRALSSKLGRRI